MKKKIRLINKKSLNKIKKVETKISENSFVVFLKRIIKLYADKDVFLYSSNSSYFFIMALIPIAMLIFSTISLIPNASIDRLVLELEFLVPSMDEFSGAVETVIKIAKGLTTKSILSINVIFAIVASSAVLHSISNGIRNIHGHIKDETFLKEKAYAIINIIFLLAVTFVLVVLFLFGDRIMNLMDTYLPFNIKIINNIFNLRYPIAIIFLFSFLLSIYTTSTRFTRKFKHTYIGAVISAVLWITVSNLFSLFFTYFPLNKGIYGAFSSIIIIMIWLLICVNTILIGSIVNEILYPQKEIEDQIRKLKKKKLK